MNNVLKLLAGAGIGIVVIMIIGIWSVSNEPEQTTALPISAPSPVPPPVEEWEWTDSDRDTYVNGCAAEGVTRSYCECTLEIIEDEYTVLEAAEMGVEYGNTGVISDNMWEIVRACSHEL